MDMKKFSTYAEAMERLDAQEMLSQLKVSDYQNMKEDSRNKLYKSLNKRAFPVQKVHSFDDIEAALGIR